MGIIILRLLVIFYVLGMVFVLFRLISSKVVKDKNVFFAILFFPILLMTEKGRNFLKEIMKGI